MEELGVGDSSPPLPPWEAESAGQTAGNCMTKVCDGSVLGAEKMGGVGHLSPFPPLICLGGSSRLPCEPNVSLNVCKLSD